MRTLFTFSLAACLAVHAVAAATFTDVPRSHWAYAAIQRASDAGILQGYDGRFHGEKTLNRYQVATVIQRILANVEARGGPAAAGMDLEQVDELLQLVQEFADALATVGARVTLLEESLRGSQADIDALKAGRGAPSGAGAGLGSAFRGFVSVGLVSTDDGTGTSGLGPRTRWVGGTADQTFFTIPQASMALDTEVRPGMVLHVQYDYSTDAPSALVGGTGVGLNEAYMMVDELFGEVGMKIGGFALPLQSWEVNGPFRSLDRSITPSVANTYFEGFRVVGAELSPVRELDSLGFRWRLGAFNSGDRAPLAGGLVNAFSTMNDAVGLGGLTGSATIDGSWGFYLDLESLDDPEACWGWRASAFDTGGNILATAPNTASREQNGWQVGFWWKKERLEVLTQYVRLESSSGVGAANDTDSYAWYLLVNWELDEDATITLRYDDFENILDQGSPQPGNEGDAYTFAYNRRMSGNSMVQLEWLSIDHENLPAVPGASDIDDDLLQLRYKVWF